ncbi:ADP-ribosylation factor [Colletotrichum tofieldiae]|uniref:ADP-ribosylation factor (Gelsolin) n=1 Tax=Colletotrichum tofieldiae TaxID=708197 RepID=A0A166R807_9PEZI|nr:ADP-ribosylation factor (gelsolin) [Colletotrichum tofieldiae]GKT53040.1 ADP-ribosylation factor [Colletotrichum tofieldiae]GKT80562.1 ADP-ribosylation factor [Colletotrichum tofieldiae]
MSEQAMDDVSKFLQDVKEMNARRTEEDDARQRELDEKIQQEKRERQARRAERARSISPQKSSPANTPPPSSRGNTAQLSDDLKLSSPGLELTGSPRPHSRGSPAPDTMERLSTSPTKENESPFDADNKRSSVTSPTGGVQGARPLSWQRRPNSQHSDRSKSRPLSVVAAENAARTSPNPTSDPSSATEQTFSRDQISQALGSKDPAWFRQTADRASVGSAANRKSQVEDTDTTDMSSMRAHQLPGLSRSSSTDLSPEHSSPTKENRLGSPLSLSSAQRLDPPAEISSENDTSAQRRMSVMSSGSGRASPTRPVSPTKGMGGFVQSAMMKRSDSVKRWSVTSPPGLVRADSAASSRVGEPRSRPQSMFIRDGAATPTGSSHSHSRSLSRPASRPSSRPTSRHSNQEHQDETETTPKAPAAAPPLEAKPDTKEEDEEKLTPPSSPSKTMDTRRWSPTKASWLETALNKPEAPKPKPPPTANQPAWMVELNKAKAHKAANPSADLNRSGSVASNKHEVNIGGLMRSTPMGSHEAKPSVSGLKGIYAPVKTHKTGGSIGSPSFRSSTIKSPTSEDKPDDTTAPVELPKRSSVTDSPAVAKVKPETPPKKDFRAGLKSRNVSGDAASSKDPANELQNVFGNLRRTKTQNYVAPDELKSNISRGKAALNFTGGPKPSERKDEFKEAILKKKDDFKAVQSQGKGVARTKSNASENPVPEALLKRHALSKSISGRSDATSPSAIEHRKSISERSKSVSKDESSESIPSLRSPSIKSPTSKSPDVLSPTELRPTTPTLQKETSAPARLQGRAAAGGLAGRFNPALAGLLARGPPPMAANGGRDAEKPEESSGATEPTAPGPQLTHMTKGRARGPKRKAPSSKGPSAGASATEPANEPKPSSTVTSPAKEEPLVVAEEPKKSPEKEAPASIQAQVAAQAAAKNRPAPLKPFGKPAEPPVEKPAEASPEKPILPAKEEEPVSKRRSRSPTMKLQSSPIKQFEEKPSEPTSQPASPKKLDMKRVSRFFEEKNQETTKPESPKRESLKTESTKREEPKTASPKTEEPKMESPKREEPKRESLATTPSIKPKPVFEKPFSPPPQKTEEVSPVKTFGRPLPEPTPSPAKKTFSDNVEESSPPARTFGRPLPEPTPRSPIRSPIRSPPPNDQPDSPHVAPLRTFGRPLSRPSSPQKSNDKVDSEPVVSVRNAAAMFGGSVVQSPPLETRSRFDTPASPVQRTSTPSRGSARPLPIPPKPSSPARVASPVRSPTKSSSEVSALLDDFFGTRRPQREYHLDTAEVLMNKPRVRDIQSQGARLFQITGDGKKIPVSAHNERILFEREMYICANVFTNEAGRKETEVYFWAGDEVPEATMEDAALFVSREARSLGGKVIKMRQGRETPEFIMALGGMIIIRRGTNAKYDSLAPSMLCGRRMLGQVVFDEVNFSSTSLCSGFPFLITQSGKCYLWKGKGSDVDELSCARLIGMDLSLMGELLEIEDGSEPDSFWAIFNDGTKPHSADHWRLKSNYEKYCQRLFRSDASAAQQVYEISPFTQADLDPSGIYVLDAFFEMYIIVGRTAQSQYGSFRNALDFAQEYAILASGMEDRPFIPISTVVLEGIPKDLKSVFRKWRDEASPTIMPKKTPGLKRGRSLRVVPLTHALQAMSE